MSDQSIISSGISIMRHSRDFAKYRPDIDGIRAVAVLAVVGFHAFPVYFPGGFIGVDVFFVISGFLISGIIADKIATNSFTYLGFYSRRIRRIFPALMSMLVAVMIVGRILFLPDEFENLVRQVAAGVLFSANILFWRDAGYFDSASTLKPLLHLWSLGVEEQFYMIWPLLMMLIWKRQNRVLIIGLIGAISFGLNIVLVHAYPVATFYLPGTRFWELMLGAGVAATRGWGEFRHSVVIKDGLSLLGLAMILVSGEVYNSNIVFPGWAAAIPTLGTALIIAVGPSAWVSRRLLALRPVVFVGLISYPLYLWHWPLLAIMRTEVYGEVSPMLRLAAVCFALLLSVLTYHVVEQPVRRRLTKSVPAYLAAGMALVGVVAVGMLTVSDASPRRDAVKTGKAAQLQWSYWENATCDSKYVFAHKQGWWFCAANSEGPPSIILMGNSFANHLYPGLVMQEALARKSILSIGTCPPTDGIHSTEEDVGENPCAGQRKDEQDEFLENLIRSSPSIRFAIVNSSWPRFTANGGEADFFSGKPSENSFYSTYTDEQRLSQRQMYSNGLERRITFLESRGIRVILFLNEPRLPYDVRKCLDRPFRAASKDCSVETAIELNAAKSFDDIAREIQGRHPNMLVFDPMPVFCPARFCHLMSENEIYLRDSHHLSVEGSRLLARSFVIWASANVPQLLGNGK